MSAAGVPVLGVGAVIVKDGKAVIVRRAKAPYQSEWSVPGGRVELGEALVEAVRREMKEETGLDVDVRDIIEVFERIERNEAGVRYHFVIVDYWCTCFGGTLCAGDDAADAAWVSADDLDAYGVSESAARVIRKGLQLALQFPA